MILTKDDREKVYHDWQNSSTALNEDGLIQMVESALLEKLRGGVELPEPAGYYEQEYIGEPSRIEARFDHDQLLQYGDARALAASEREGWKWVPVEFLRGFNVLAHNYSLPVIAPDYYQGVERDAFQSAYARCGADLAILAAVLAASPQEQT